MAYIRNSSGGSGSGQVNPSEQSPGSSYAGYPSFRFLETMNFFKPNESRRGGEGGYGNEGRALLGSRGDTGQIRNVLLDALLMDKEFRSNLLSKNEEFLEDYQQCVDAHKCFRCAREEMEWHNDPCGHQMWCIGCKLWALEVVRQHPHLCVICDHQVNTMGRIPGRSSMTCWGPIPVRAAGSKQNKKKERKEHNRAQKMLSQK